MRGGGCAETRHTQQSPACTSERRAVLAWEVCSDPRENPSRCEQEEGAGLVVAPSHQARTEAQRRRMTYLNTQKKITTVERKKINLLT